VAQMKIPVARVISIVGHPFVLLVLLVLLPRLQNSPSDAVHKTLLFAGIVLVPLALLIWRCVSSGEWRTVDASDREDRPLLYRTILAVLCVATVYFVFVERTPAIGRGCGVSAGMVAIAAAGNRWIKVSLHVAFACFCGILLGRVRLAFGLPILLLVPALIWSRVVLSRHVFSKTIGGVILGGLGAACFIWL
jgi:hypothetical protein